MFEDTFARSWSVEVLAQPPLIAPARQFVYPLNIAGEEDALNRGAFRLLVKPAAGGVFLATCALGFTDPTMPSGVYGCPDAAAICAVAGGYAYIVDTARPEHCVQVPLKPVAGVYPLAAQGLLVFAGFHTLVGWGAAGLAWTTGRLSWEGVRVTAVDGDQLHGFGWEMRTDKEFAFTVNLRTGEHTGGGYR